MRVFLWLRCRLQEPGLKSFENIGRVSMFISSVVIYRFALNTTIFLTVTWSKNVRWIIDRMNTCSNEQFIIFGTGVGYWMCWDDIPAVPEECGLANWHISSRYIGGKRWFEMLLFVVFFPQSGAASMSFGLCGATCVQPLSFDPPKTNIFFCLYHMLTSHATYSTGNSTSRISY